MRTTFTANPIKERKEPASFVFQGTIFCIIADIMFGLSSFFLRGLTLDHVSPDWILMIKELIVALGAIGVLCACRNKQRLFPSLKIMAAIFAIAFFGETVGLRSLVTAYGLIGIVLANPVIRSFTIMGTILLGAIFLHEKPGRYRLISMIILVFSLFLLAAGQVDPGSKFFGIHSLTPKFLIGFLFAAMAGSGYALYSILMRGILRKINGESRKDPQDRQSGSVSIFLITAIVCGYGSLSGGVVLLSRQGMSGITDVPYRAWSIVALAGISSFFAIWFKSLAFRYATAGKVAVFSVLQLVLGAILGMIFYQEPSDNLIWIALILTVFGICLSARSE